LPGDGFTEWSSLGGDHLSVHEVVEDLVELSPCDCERAALAQLGRKTGAQRSKGRSEHGPVGLGEKHRDPPPERCQLVAVGAVDARDESVTSEPPEVIGRRVFESYRLAKSGC